MMLSPEQRAFRAGSTAWGPGWRPTTLVKAPGRLELLGNHVDYNGGLVLAAAVEQHIAMVIDDRGEAGTISLLPSDVMSIPTTLDLAEWTNWRNEGNSTGPVEYARGVIAALAQAGITVRDGQRVAIAGNVPLGYGMSSSAALCVGYVLAFTDADLPPVQVVTLAQEAEHRCGSPVGAMDQSASIAGGVILFEGRDTSFTSMEPNLGDLVFVVADSGVSHAIGTSSYPHRVEESAEALRILQHDLGMAVESLGELDPIAWQRSRDRFEASAGKTLTQRVEHVVTEVQRVREGCAAVEAEDWTRFGVLMTASGRSSSLDYQISHPLVDELVEEILAVDRVLGARMMGGGEGGPALALVHADAVPELRERLTAGYFRRQASHLQGERLLVASFGEALSVLHGRPSAGFDQMHPPHNEVRLAEGEPSISLFGVYDVS
jgi:galactokinase